MTFSNVDFEQMKKFLESVPELSDEHFMMLEQALELDLMSNIPGGWGGAAATLGKFSGEDLFVPDDFFEKIVEVQDPIETQEFGGIPPIDPPEDDDDDDGGGWDDPDGWSWIVEVNKWHFATCFVVCGTISLVSYMKGRQAQRDWVDKWTSM